MHIRRGISGIIRNFWLTTKIFHQELFARLKDKKMQIYWLNQKSKKY